MSLGLPGSERAFHQQQRKVEFQWLFPQGWRTEEKQWVQQTWKRWVDCGGGTMMNSSCESLPKWTFEGNKVWKRKEPKNCQRRCSWRSESIAAFHRGKSTLQRKPKRTAREGRRFWWWGITKENDEVQVDFGVQTRKTKKPKSTENKERQLSIPNSDQELHPLPAWPALLRGFEGGLTPTLKPFLHFSQIEALPWISSLFFAPTTPTTNSLSLRALHTSISPKRRNGAPLNDLPFR